jgi:uncharacterized membrane protein
MAAGRANRIDAIDVVRGSAMLMVFLSHFSVSYLRVVGAARWHAGQAWLTTGATPTFVLVSGMMLGLLRARPGDFADLRDKLIDRGLFLLVVGRALIAAAHIAVTADWRLPFIDQVYITDSIGVSLILGAIAAQWVDEWGRLRLGLCILITSWVLDVTWMPVTWGMRLVKELLFGRLLGESLLYNFPLLPWFGWYLVGSGLGAFVVRAHAEGGTRAAARVLLRAAAVGVAVVVLAKVAGALLKIAHAGGLTTTAGRLLTMLGVTQKLPPGVTYLFFYGALAVVVVGGALLLGARLEVCPRWATTAWRWLAMLGRNSLPAFVLQFYVYYTAVYLLPKPPLWLAPLYFVFTMALLMGMVAVCDRLRLNRMFSLGFTRIAAERRRRRLDHAFRRPLAVTPNLGALPPPEPPGPRGADERR